MAAIACYGTAMLRPIAPLLLAAVTLTLGACASDKEGYPSLARRPIERISGTAPVVTPTETPPPAPPSAEVLGRLDLAIAQARSADARFHQRTDRTRALVNAARNAPVASEAWSVATVAVSDLESARSDAMIALADVDAAYAKSRIAGEDTSAITAARDQIVAFVSSEDAVLADFRNALAD